MKEYHFLDGSKVSVPADTCRGCYMEENPAALPLYIKPVIQNENINVRQDAECPVPGFYIISLRKHIHSIGDVDESLAATLGVCVHIVRKGMKEALGIDRAHIYLEERIVEPHYHTWLLPLWSDVMWQHDIDPKVWRGNIKPYLDLFSFEAEKEKILTFNCRLRAFLLKTNFAGDHGFF